MLLARREPHDIARPDFLDGTALALNAPHSESNDQCLTERMRVLGGSGARLERDAGAGDAGRIERLEQRVDRTEPVNQSPGPLADGCAPFRLISMATLL
jgi:hypothetical protein